MDDLFEGWSGLPTVDAQLDGLLRPLAGGRSGPLPPLRLDPGAYAETVMVRRRPLLVLEGVGPGSLMVADLATVLVWVEAP